jgi:hypothetical protein
MELLLTRVQRMMAGKVPASNAPHFLRYAEMCI